MQVRIIILLSLFIIMNSCTFIRKIQYPEVQELVHNVSINENYLVENIDNNDIVSKENLMSKHSDQRVRYLSESMHERYKNGYFIKAIYKSKVNFHGSIGIYYGAEVQSEEFKAYVTIFWFTKESGKLLLYDITYS